MDISLTVAHPGSGHITDNHVFIIQYLTNVSKNKKKKLIQVCD